MAVPPPPPSFDASGATPRADAPASPAPASPSPGASAGSGRLTPGQATPASSPASAGGRRISELQKAYADPSRRIGRYVVVRELGRGGMGVVYRAYDPQLQRDVALKVMRDAALANDRERERFAREARAAARLRHPGIVTVHEVGEHVISDPQGGTPRRCPFLVMDFVEGETLEDSRARARIAPRRVAKIVRDLARALHAAHEQGVVHRDLKPQNVLLDAEGRPHLVDFGLAQTHEDARMTKTGQLVGTPHYVAPEQARGDREATGPRSDVYGLGGVLYSALTGRPPFDGNTIVEVLRQVFTLDPTPPSRHEPTVHADLETITLKCLEKAPERRYGSAEEVARELDRFLDGEAIAARPAGRVRRLGRWARQNRLTAAVLVFLAVGVVAAAVVGIVFLTELRRQVEAQRAEIVAAARVEADRAGRDLALARAERPPADEPPARARARRDRLLALGLDAFQAAITAHALDLDDDSARQAAFDRAIDYGDVALAEQQWGVAASAYDRALTLDVDDGLARARIEGVTVERERAANARRDAVEAVLAAARSGELDRRSGGWEDALFELVRYPDEVTVSLLADELDGTSEALREVTRTIFLDAARPSAEEAAAGEEVVGGVEEVLELWWAVSAEVVPNDVKRRINQLEHRIARRHRAESRLGSTRVRAAREVLSAEQERVVGVRRMRLASLCCDALGRIGIGELAVESLERYLGSEEHELRAVRAGAALCLIGDDAAERIVRQSIGRFGTSGSYWPQVSRLLHRTGEETSLLEETWWGHAERGLARYQKGQLAGALEDFDRAIELRPDDPHLLGNRGMARVRTGDVAGALEDFEAAVALAEWDGACWINLAKGRTHAGDLPGARAAADRACDLAPTSGMIFRERAGIRRAQGDIEGARVDLDRALELDPNDALAFSNRGLIRLRQDDKQGAIHDLSCALDRDPQLAAAWCNRGRVRMMIGQHAEAIVDLTQAIELAPQMFQAHYSRAMAREHEGDLRGGIADLDAVLEITPENGRALSRRGQFRSRLGEMDEALADLDRALEVGFTPAYGDRGFVRELAGDLEGALADLTELLRLHPGDPRAPRVRSSIASIKARLGQ